MRTPCHTSLFYPDWYRETFDTHNVAIWLLSKLMNAVIDIECLFSSLLIHL